MKGFRELIFLLPVVVLANDLHFKKMVKFGGEYPFNHDEASSLSSTLLVNYLVLVSILWLKSPVKGASIKCM